ncbi:MoaD/ThiS family protein [Alteromonas sp. C1M14]|uniref:MoaD/ThiS family protein n=1 Tax=Alteromonas sp. C1M14 TaxID=2841567 RepID=UPI001C09AD26|nr:MoaD/ThiS family protein [Alteromonas sp. C1M14]MBU2977140.1 MoaD/ThiS family protein [Alteromonas sp. C1M14]
MINIKTFAQVREVTQEAGFSLPLEKANSTVADVKVTLRMRAPCWGEALDDGVLCAVNQVLCDDSHPVAEGDEVAFFPPVTGG